MESKIAFVTGASKGVGRGIAYGLADAGWDVAVNYYSDEAGAEETKSVIESKGRRCFTVSGDVGDKMHVEAMFSAVVAELIYDLHCNSKDYQCLIVHSYRY